MTETIFALASGAGRAGVAVYRLSGPDSGRALERLGGRPLPLPRRAQRLRLEWKGETIDDGLALWFPAPASFTGEDVVEFHLHGGRAVAAALTEALLDLGLRPAEPGEYSRRAFEAGKLDLTQAEAIADLVAADTAAQRRQALRQMDGALTALTEGWRSRLVHAQARIEAEIDFIDEDLPGEPLAAAREELSRLAGEIRTHLDDGGRGERLRDGAQVVLLGPVNVGKSSLLNRLAGRPAAIVSPEPGTTRDVVEVVMDLAGYPAVFADTAGLRDSAQAIEAEGIRRARSRAETADLRLVVFDATVLPALDQEGVALVRAGRALPVFNKVDRATAPLPEEVAGQAVLAVSALTGQGLDGLLARVTDAVVGAESAGVPPVTRARHRAALEQALAALSRAVDAPLPELLAEDVRVAARSLGRISGRIDVEDVLDAIFREFCIGK